MFNNRLVSIITPVFNGGHFLLATAQSILNQTYQNWEWIIVDDASEDETKKMAKELAQKDPRIQVICHIENSGPIIARNSALDKAKGRYIAFLDADDLWTPDKLSNQLDFMDREKTGLSFTSYRKIDEQGKSISLLTIKVPKKVTRDMLIKSDSIPTSSAIFDRNLAGDLRQNPTFPVPKDDLLFWLEVLDECRIGRGLQEVHLLLRIHKTSITNHKLKMAVLQWKLYRNYFRFNLFKSFCYFVVYAIIGFIKFIL